MKKKGLSLEQKCDLLRNALLETKTFHNYKEIEKIALSLNIPWGTIKDVVKCLVGEQSINSDKVGSINLYWVLASDQNKKFFNESAKLTKSIEREGIRQNELKNQLDILMQSRNNNINYDEVLMTYKRLKEDYDNKIEQKKQRELLTTLDPELDLKNSTEAVWRWIDNLYIIRSFVLKLLRRSNSRISETTVDDLLDIPVHLRDL